MVEVLITLLDEIHEFNSFDQEREYLVGESAGAAALGESARSIRTGSPPSSPSWDIWAGPLKHPAISVI